MHTWLLMANIKLLFYPSANITCTGSSRCFRAPGWTIRGAPLRRLQIKDRRFQMRIFSVSSCVPSPTGWRSSESCHQVSHNPNQTDPMRDFSSCLRITDEVTSSFFFFFKVCSPQYFWFPPFWIDNVPARHKEESDNTELILILFWQHLWVVTTFFFFKFVLPPAACFI